MFGYTRTTAVQVFNGITELETNPLPYTLVVVMLGLALIMYLLSRLALASGGAASAVKGHASSSAVSARGFRKILAPLAFLAVTLAAVSPHIALILTAVSRNWYGTVLPEHLTFLHFDNALSHKIVLPSIVNSLKYSSLAMLFALAVGILLSLIVVRWRFRGAFILDILAMTPLAVPGIVIAFGYLGMSVKYSWAHELFNPVDNPLLLLAAAYAIRRLPYVVRSVTAGTDSRRTGIRLAQSWRECVPDLAAGDASPDYRQHRGRRAVCVQLLDAGGFRLPDSCAESGVLPDHTCDFRTLDDSRGGPGYGVCVRRLDDGIHGGDAWRGGNPARTQDRRHFPAVRCFSAGVKMKKPDMFSIPYPACGSFSVFQSENAVFSISSILKKSALEILLFFCQIPNLNVLKSGFRV